MPVSISAIVNTYNEEANIESCLQCLTGQVDEIIVSDMHSSDGTVSICERFGAKVGFQPKQKFVGTVREEPAARAQHEWLFVIDADETVQPELFQRLREAAEGGKADIVAIHRINTFFDHNYTGQGWPIEPVDRFFRKDAVKFLEHPHHWIQRLGNAITLEPRREWSITHHGNRTIGDFIRKMNDYTDSEAKLMLSLGWKFDFKRALLRPLRFFWEHFVTYKGYKSGSYGVALACLWAVYWHVAALKLWQLELQSTSSHEE